MNLLLTRLGKVCKTLRQQGLARGAKRIGRYLSIYFRYGFSFSPKGDVLILGAGIGDVGHYRIFTQTEEFNLHGIKTCATLQDNPFLPGLVDNFKVFILVRPVYTPKIAALIEKIKKQNKTIIFDTDDLVFDATYMHQTEAYQKMNTLEKRQYEKGVGEEILKDSYVKTCSTSTAFLKKALEKFGKTVYINTNKISLHELEIAEKINEKNCHSEHSEESQNKTTRSFSNAQDDSIKLGYFSGTNTHNKDFATIAEPLYRLMQKYANVRLVLVGPLEIESRLNEFKDRIIQTGLVSRDKHYENLASVDINLAPSVLNDPFSEAKSELKFFEAGIVEVPTVAVANETYSGCITDGENGFLCKNEEEWFAKLERLVLDADFRRQMGKKAYQKALKDYTIKNSHNEEYYDFLKSYNT